MPTPSPLRVLLIEDHPAEQLLVQAAFVPLASDATLEVMDSAAAALARLQDDTQPLPHVLLLDLQLPGTSGYEVLHALKRDPRTSRIPVVILTAAAETTRVQQAYAEHASAFLEKPTTLDAYVEHMTAFVHFWRIAHPPHR